MSTTAEGIETREQFDAIKSEGCSDIQGFLVSRPKACEEIEQPFSNKSWGGSQSL